MTDKSNPEGRGPEALRPKFGDLLRNTIASESNPHRDAYFIREVTLPGGEVNPGHWFEMTDGKGETWLSNPKNMVPALRTQQPAPAGATLHDIDAGIEVMAWLRETGAPHSIYSKMSACLFGDPDAPKPAPTPQPSPTEQAAESVGRDAEPDLTKLTERGAKAWAGVDAQALREGHGTTPKEGGQHGPA